MFSVKATYNNETRKFAFSSGSFPSYTNICNQLYRVFPLRGSYYLSGLLFSPAVGTRVVVGKEVHNEAEYNAHIAPFVGRLWPGGLLRFSVIDDTPHKRPGGLPPVLPSSMPGFLDIPPPPPCVLEPPASLMEVDSEPAASPSNRNSTFSQSSRDSCCSVAEGKAEVKDLMTNFIGDLNKVMTTTFGNTSESPVTATPRASSLPMPAVPLHTVPDIGEANNLHIPGAFQPDLGFIERFGASHPPLPATPRSAMNAHNIDPVGQGQQFPRPHLRPSQYFGPGIVPVSGSPHAHRTPYNSTGPSMSRPLPPVRRGPVVHKNIICDLCDKEIVGNRHKCLDCPDYDLCDECYSRVEIFHPPHQFFVIEEPGRVIVHTVFSGDDDRQKERQNVRNVRAGSSSETPATSTATPVVHQANCDMCDSRIRGDRYKCLTCPDFDTCASCYSITSEQHPKHVFVKISELQDLIPKDPSRYKRHFAHCDCCKKIIRGIRYKCMHPECPDYDLCDKCEALPINVHPDTHPMLKMRRPDVVIPTVYRVGGTTIIGAPTPRMTPPVAIQSTHNRKEPAMTETVKEAIEPEIQAKENSLAQGFWESISDPNTVNTRDSTFSEDKEKISKVDVSKVDNVLIDLGSEIRPSTTIRVADRLLNDLLTMERPSNEQKTYDEAKTMTELRRPQVLGSLFPTNSPKEPELRATFVSDNNIEDGQIFPAGAEFIKTWKMLNDGEIAWPESTELVFVAGDRLLAFEDAPIRYHVGKVEPSALVDVYAADMKAPEVPGKYVGYWRLSADSKPFGQSVWCDIVVPAQEKSSSLHESLTSSEVIMPRSASAPVLPDDLRSHPAFQSGMTTPELELASTVPSTPPTPTMASDSSPSSPPSEIDDDDSSVSLLDDFETASDAGFWEASRSQVRHNIAPSPDVEYVVLYDDESSEDEAH